MCACHYDMLQYYHSINGKVDWKAVETGHIFSINDVLHIDMRVPDT